MLMISKIGLSLRFANICISATSERAISSLLAASSLVFF